MFARIIVVLSLVVMLFVAFSSNAFAYCPPGDTWCQWQEAAQRGAQQAQTRLNRDWNNVGNDAFGQQNVQRFSQGLQNTYHQATSGGFFNCTSYTQKWDAYAGRYVTVCNQ
jgi:hypothetical protein